MSIYTIQFIGTITEYIFACATLKNRSIFTLNTKEIVLITVTSESLIIDGFFCQLMMHLNTTFKFISTWWAAVSVNLKAML